MGRKLDNVDRFFDVQLGIGRDELARLAGVDPSTVWRWIKGHQQPHPAVLSLVSILQQGELRPLGGPLWDGWILGRAGLLGPWMKRPMSPEHIMRIPILEARIRQLERPQERQLRLFD
jgi:hypothetical protein